MAMNEIVAWAQVVGALAVILTFLVYWRQLIAMQAQVAAARDSSRTQNLLGLIDYIQQPVHTEARFILINLEGKQLSSWSSEERRSAERACSAWDAVGMVLKNTTIPHAKELVVAKWRHSIRSCYKAAEELIRELRASRDIDFWNDFEWLAKEALETSGATNARTAQPGAQHGPGA